MNKFGIVITITLLFVGCSMLKPTKGDIVVPVPPKNYTNAQAATYYYLQAIKLKKIHGDLSNALRYLEKAVEYDSLHAPSYYQMASITKAEYALPMSIKANSIDTLNLWYKQQLAQLLITSKKYDSALVVYNDLTKIAPNNPDNYSYMAILHKEIGQPFTAISILDSAQTRFGINESLSTLKRELLIETGLIDRAIAETKTLVDNFPYDQSNYLILAELYSRSNKDSLAMNALSQAEAIDANSLPYLATLSDYYKRKKDIPSYLNAINSLVALNEISLANKLSILKEITSNTSLYGVNYLAVNKIVTTIAMAHPKNFDVKEAYAAHLISGGYTEDALNVYKNSLNDSLRIEAINAITEIESYLGRNDSLLKYADMAINLAPKDPITHLRKGYALFATKDYKGAERKMVNALKFAESDSLKSSIYSTIGDIKFSTDSSNTKKYYPLYEKALKLNANNILALNNYSYYLSLEEKKLDKALQMIKRVMEIAPLNPTYIDTYGWVLYKLGRYEEAKKVMRQAVSLDASASPELMFHYGDVLYKLNEYFMASIYWKKAMDKGYNKQEIEKRLKLIENK